MAVAATAAAVAFASGGVRGAPGAGDPFFPKAGNGGYDVAHYDLRLDYSQNGKVVGKTTIEATTTQRLRRFDLDFRRLTVRSLRVDGRPAAFRRKGQELIISPIEALEDGADFEVVVRYSGKPRPVHDPDGTIEGWVPTADGAHVVGEPQGSPSWFPCNDHPTDKATYQFHLTVPDDLVAVANGILVDQSALNGRARFDWSEPDPMATYLATATIGRFDVSTGEIDLDGHPDPVPSYVAVDPDEGPGAADRVGDILRFFDDYFGPYPFAAAGAIVDRAPRLGYALETQTRPSFDRSPDGVILAHELSHQWFGDSVSLVRWRDIWLNEGFATWAEWWWREHDGGATAAQTFDHLYSTHSGDSAFWNPPPADPGSPKRLFSGSIYERGAMTLQALRERIGDDDVFFDILRTWTGDHGGGNARIREFIALAEEKSGLELGRFFHRWLYERGKPPAPTQRGPAGPLAQPRGASAPRT